MPDVFIEPSFKLGQKRLAIFKEVRGAFVTRVMKIMTTDQKAIGTGRVRIAFGLGNRTIYP